MRGIIFIRKGLRVKEQPKFKYKVSRYGSSIKRLEIKRETDNTVWVKSYGQYRKRSDGFCFCDTLEEAKQEIVDKLKKDLDYHRIMINKIEDKIKEIEEMQDEQ